MAREKNNGFGTKDVCQTIGVAASATIGTALMAESGNQVRSGNYLTGAVMFTIGASCDFLLLKLLWDLNKQYHERQKHTNMEQQRREQRHRHK